MFWLGHTLPEKRRSGLNEDLWAAVARSLRSVRQAIITVD
jgi:hypothetical protein